MPSPSSLSFRAAAAALALAGAAAATTAADPALAAEGIERVSVGPGGAQGDEYSSEPAISADGRYVAFVSGATNLVPGDTNGTADVFVRDRRTGTTRRVSVGPGGLQGDEASFDPAISADGRFVAFASFATNLVPGDTNGESDVFLHDTATGTTRRVSVRRDGVQGNGYSQNPALSADGRYVAFQTAAERLTPGETGDERHILLRDMRTGTLRLVSAGPGGVPANGYGEAPTISPTGRFVGFYSDATNLVAGDVNGEADVFVYDARTREVRLASVGAGGVQSNGFSADPAFSSSGSVVAFLSTATNLVPGDTNGVADIFVRDFRAGTTQRVSVGPGRVQGDGESFSHPSVSSTGRFVAFDSFATNLVAGDTNGESDVFLHDRRTGVTRRPSVGSDGVQADSFSFAPALSADGRYVAFHSEATNLVPGDTNGTADVFVRTRR